MKIGASKRRLLLAAALVSTVAAAVWDERSEPMTVALAETERQPAVPPGTRKGQAELPDIDFDKLEGKHGHDQVGDAFEPRSWAPPPAAVKPPPPAPPQAPPLPYTYIGKMMEGGQIVVFLTNQGRNYAVHNGDKLDNVYQVDEIKGDILRLTYLPLNIQQSIAIGSAN